MREGYKRHNFLDKLKSNEVVKQATEIKKLIAKNYAKNLLHFYEAPNYFFIKFLINF